MVNCLVVIKEWY